MKKKQCKCSFIRYRDIYLQTSCGFQPKLCCPKGSPSFYFPSPFRLPSLSGLSSFSCCSSLNFLPKSSLISSCFGLPSLSSPPSCREELTGRTPRAGTGQAEKRNTGNSCTKSRICYFTTQKREITLIVHIVDFEFLSVPFGVL